MIVVPDEITKLLGCHPSKSQTKRDVIRGSKTSCERIAKTGMWRLFAADCEPEDFNGQIQELLGKFTSDLNVWSSIKRRFKIDLSCGLFMEETNEGAAISAETLRLLGERGIELSFDIYAPTKEIEGNAPCPCGSWKLYRDCCQPEVKNETPA